MRRGTNGGNERPQRDRGATWPLTVLDARPTIRASERRPRPQRLRAPSPFLARFARHSTRGKPAQPSALNALPAPVLTAFDLSGFPAPPARAPGLSPPDWLPARRRASGWLGPPAPTGSPLPYIDRAGARRDSGGCGQRCPSPRPADGWARLPTRPSATAEQRQARGFGEFMARTVTRPCELSRRDRRDYRHRRRGLAFRLSSPSPTHSDRPPFR